MAKPEVNVKRRKKSVIVIGVTSSRHRAYFARNVTLVKFVSVGRIGINCLTHFFLLLPFLLRIILFTN